MENIARKTEQETTSMHVITFVTLLFLPGTFLAVSRLAVRLKSKPLTLDQSFFQSGIIQLKVPEAIDGDWMLLSGPWELFAKISFGLMLGVFVIWGIVYGYLRHRAHRRIRSGSDDMV